MTSGNQFRVGRSARRASASATSAVRAGYIDAVAHRAAEPNPTEPRQDQQRSPTPPDPSLPSRLGLPGKPRRVHDLTGNDPKLRRVYRRCRAYDLGDWRDDRTINDPTRPHTHLRRPTYGFGDMRDGATN